MGMDEAEMDRHVKSALQRKDNAAYLLKTVTESLASKYVSSYFSINLLLRLFLHIFGDIHQPLHSMTYIAPDCFPNTDRGGNLIQVKIAQDILDQVDAKSDVSTDAGFHFRTSRLSSRADHLSSRADHLSSRADTQIYSPTAWTHPHVVRTEGAVFLSLHALWDSGGLRFGRSYPDFPVTDSNEVARAIMVRNPNVTHETYANVIRESYELASAVYGGVIEHVCTDSADFTTGPDLGDNGTKMTRDLDEGDSRDDEPLVGETRTPAVAVDLEYLQLVRRVTEARIAQAGFSLAFYLNDFARGVDEDQVLGSDDATRNWWKVYSVAVTFALMFFVLYAKCRPRPTPVCVHHLATLNDNVHMRRTRRYKTRNRH
ncbi:S1/P1 nuclease [Gregarina niphandrodes]|uniref:S1/P1 nuclease n=1 Tax=Gregarina niphandrodes TaxID=110365 RepID=A0A023B2A3_GRENI|nr:S1/P1 nuclease [Gregarina niphandrodes]EZG51803.1 S1/P1 nuclease [Gregarina niphandrodes]|eukprot:XP_011131914.1 S1/P1 nuclease [Gregarina niphandrodes]